MRLESIAKDSHSVLALLKSFYHAFCGLFTALKLGRNLKIHFLISLFVLLAGGYVSLSNLEWSIVLILINQVIVTELINTSLEFVVDLTSPTYHPLAKHAKDIAAGAVLFSAIMAAIGGIVIFLPYII